MYQCNSVNTTTPPRMKFCISYWKRQRQEQDEAGLWNLNQMYDYVMLWDRCLVIWRYCVLSLRRTKLQFQKSLDWSKSMLFFLVLSTIKMTTKNHLFFYKCFIFRLVVETALPSLKTKANYSVLKNVIKLYFVV